MSLMIVCSPFYRDLCVSVRKLMRLAPMMSHFINSLTATVYDDGRKAM